MSAHDDMDRVEQLLRSAPAPAAVPPGLIDVAREAASVVIDDLRELGVPSDGSISIEEIDSQLSTAAERAERAAPGSPGDAVVWEEVEARTSESVELNANFLAFMVLACLIASVGIMLGQPILIVGAMVVGPEFGPLAGLSDRNSPISRSSTAATPDPLSLMPGPSTTESRCPPSMTTRSGSLPGSSAMIERDGASFVVAFETRWAVPPDAAAAARASPTGRVTPAAGIARRLGSIRVGRSTAPASAAG